MGECLHLRVPAHGPLSPRPRAVRRRQRARRFAVRPAPVSTSLLNMADVDAFAGRVVAGAPAADAPLSIDGRSTWLLRQLGSRVTLLVYGDAPSWAAGLPVSTVALTERNDTQHWLAQRYDLQSGTAYLFRPDQHVCARWRAPTEAQVRAALARACALH